MTVAELKTLWEPEAQGKVTKWSQVRAGWPDKEIHLFGAGVDSGTYDYFTEAIVGKEHASRGDYTSSEDDNVLVQGVARDQLALGFFGFAYYEENKDKLKLVARRRREARQRRRARSLPSPETVENGTYQPLSRPLFIYVAKKAAERPEVAGVRRVLPRRTPSTLVERGRLHPAPGERLHARAARASTRARPARCSAARARRSASRSRTCLREGEGEQPRHVRPPRSGAAHVPRTVRARAAATRARDRGAPPRAAAASSRSLTTVGIIAVLLFETVGVLPRGAALGSSSATREWTPLFADKHFGIWPLVAGTLPHHRRSRSRSRCRSGCSSAIYLERVRARPRSRRVLKPMLELLAGVPTVVYGYFALMFVTPVAADGRPRPRRLQRAQRRARDGRHDPPAGRLALRGRDATPCRSGLREALVRARREPRCRRSSAWCVPGRVLGDRRRRSSSAVSRADRRDDDRRDRRRPAAAPHARPARAGRDDDRLHRPGEPRRHADRHARVPDDLRGRHDAVPDDARAEPRSATGSRRRFRGRSANEHAHRDDRGPGARHRADRRHATSCCAEAAFSALPDRARARRSCCWRCSSTSLVDGAPAARLAVPHQLSRRASPRTRASSRRSSARVCLMVLTAALAIPIGVGAAIYLEEYARAEPAHRVHRDQHRQPRRRAVDHLRPARPRALRAHARASGRSVLAGAATLALLRPADRDHRLARGAAHGAAVATARPRYALGRDPLADVCRVVLPMAPARHPDRHDPRARARDRRDRAAHHDRRAHLRRLPPGQPISSPFTALPIQIFNWVSRPQDGFHVNAAAGIVVLLALMLALNGIAIWLRQRLQYRRG